MYLAKTTLLATTYLEKWKLKTHRLLFHNFLNFKIQFDDDINLVDIYHRQERLYYCLHQHIHSKCLALPNDIHCHTDILEHQLHKYQERCQHECLKNEVKEAEWAHIDREHHDEGSDLNSIMLRDFINLAIIVFCLCFS